jgi:thiol-disulfide isomerase/thioredoxin
MKYKNVILIFFLSFILTFLISPLRMRQFTESFGGFPTSSLIGFVLFFYLTIFCVEKFKDVKGKIILFALLLGLWIIQLPIRIIDFGPTLVTLLESISHTLGIVFGYFYLQNKKPLNFILLFIGCSFVTFVFFQGYDNWTHWVSYGSFTGKVTAYKIQQKFEGINEKNNQINNQTLENKIVLLDFWHTRCGACFQKFPQLQSFYEKYKNDDSISVFAVDKPLEEDKQKSAFKVIEEEGYNFPVLVPNDEELPEKFGVKYYPTTFVINRQGNVVYKGDIEGAILMVEGLKRNNQ